MNNDSDPPMPSVSLSLLYSLKAGKPCNERREELRLPDNHKTRGLCDLRRSFAILYFEQGKRKR
ncbi:hypothetical protein L484_016826 [Morus notabilis]|uniref:Uncharacterized protein n=1 Tax=Morus notabilis TaxID=981085 RepID=W9STC1_9ROSA|nr:hypothetical protein L484_016826 [Morus notabilis]